MAMHYAISRPYNTPTFKTKVLHLVSDVQRIKWHLLSTANTALPWPSSTGI